jgi:hypothetical protein
MCAYFAYILLGKHNVVWVTKNAWTFPRLGSVAVEILEYEHILRVKEKLNLKDRSNARAFN